MDNQLLVEKEIKGKPGRGKPIHEVNIVRHEEKFLRGTLRKHL